MVWSIYSKGKKRYKLYLQTFVTRACIVEILRAFLDQYYSNYKAYIISQMVN